MKEGKFGGEGFLKKKYDLHKAPEVEEQAKRMERRTGEKVPQDPSSHIRNYFDRFMPSSHRAESEGQPVQTRAAFRLLFSLFRPYWRAGIVVVLLSIFLSAITLVNPLLVKFLIDDVLLKGKPELLTLFILLFSIVTALSIGGSVASHYLNRKLQLKVAFNVRNKLFAHIEHLGIQFFKRYKIGDALSRINTDIRAFENVFNRSIRLLMHVLSVLFIFGVIFAMNWRIAVIVVGLLPAYLFLMRYNVRKVEKLYKTIRKLSAGRLSFFEEKLAAMIVIKLFGREEYELERQKEKSKEIIQMQLRTMLIGDFSASLIGLITAITLLFILWFGGLLVIENKISIGSLIAIYTYIGYLFGPVESIANFWREMQMPLVSVTRVNEILQLPPKVTEAPDAMPLPLVKGRVTLEGVSFNYGDHPVLKDVSFDVRPGERVGIAGRSGVGKTTLALLLVRFFDLTSGKILIDGIDIGKVTLDSLRATVGYLPQEPTLFRASVRENIAYGKLGATFQEIQEVAKYAGAHEFIRRLGKGYETVLGQSGEGLSGGERQRIALARLFLKNPKIIFLDEFTAFLDAITERQVRNEISAFFRDKTVFIVSHRISSLADMDRIFVLDNHRLVEEGTFRDLLQLKGVFYQFYASQSTNLT